MLIVEIELIEGGDSCVQLDLMTNNQWSRGRRVQMGHNTPICVNLFEKNELNAARVGNLQTFKGTRGGLQADLALIESRGCVMQTIITLIPLDELESKLSSTSPAVARGSRFKAPRAQNKHAQQSSPCRGRLCLILWLHGGFWPVTES